MKKISEEVDVSNLLNQMSLSATLHKDKLFLEVVLTDNTIPNNSKHKDLFLFFSADELDNSQKHKSYKLSCIKNQLVYGGLGKSFMFMNSRYFLLQRNPPNNMQYDLSLLNRGIFRKLETKKVHQFEMYQLSPLWASEGTVSHHFNRVKELEFETDKMKIDLIFDVKDLEYLELPGVIICRNDFLNFQISFKC